MKLNYKKLGKYIRQVDVRNISGIEENLLGVSVQKKFIPSIANTVGTDFRKYKVVKKGQFTYIPDTSRRGDKIGIALLSEYDEGLVSNVYTVFEVIDSNELVPEYLMLWFSRPEFDRYSRFKSHGSVREIFDWEQLCNVELPVPEIELQKSIVKAYKNITDRISLKQKINDNLTVVADSYFADYISTFSDKNSKKLSEIIEFGNGKTRPDSTGTIPVYGGNGILAYSNISNAEDIVVIGRVGAYCGSLYLERSKCWISDNAIWAKTKHNDEEYFCYLLLRSLSLSKRSVGTGQPLLTQGILNEIQTNIPDEDSIRDFNQRIMPVFTHINNINAEIAHLETIQNLLLARLAD